MAHRPLCFVLMPFGAKPDPAGRGTIDFDRIYESAIRPAIEGSGLDVVRADEERTGGIIHKAMFERLLLCEYAIADLTTANANVFYELGVRHAVRPRTTLAIFARYQPIPFDLNFLRALPYDLDPSRPFGEAESAALRKALEERLGELRQRTVSHDHVDSPLFQLLGAWQPPSVAHLKTDVFRDQVELNDRLRREVDAARARGRAAAAGSEEHTAAVASLLAIQAGLGSLDIQEAGILIDLLLSYRALEAWTEMISLYEALPDALRRQILPREQCAFALNRRAAREKRPEDRERALRMLEEVEHDQGPSSETCGLIGRIYKDLWRDNHDAQPRVARGHLQKSIDAYRRGFATDWRDFYPGVNLVTLLELQGTPEAIREQREVLPVVRFAVEQSAKNRKVDYWLEATRLELAVLDGDVEAVDRHLDAALAAVRESWEPKTTADNLELIAGAKERRGENAGSIREVIGELRGRAL